MKTISLLTTFLIFISIVNAQTIKPEETKDYVDKEMIVCGKVYGVFQALQSNGQLTFLNFGAKYPNSLFTALVWGNTRTEFTFPLEDLNEKEVCVKGVIKLDRKQKPQIIVLKPDQIEIQK